MTVRMLVAALALAVPAAFFALNAWISFRERGSVEPLDVALAFGFAATAAWAMRGSRRALIVGTVLVAVLFATAVPGPWQILAYWLVALVALLQAFYAQGSRRPT